VTLAEAISQAEERFTVHNEIGMAVDYVDQDGRYRGDGPRDMMLAPCGEPYVTLTSFGSGEPLATAPVLFGSEGLAAQWWLDEFRDYAAEVEGTHLYWRSKPEFVSTTYLAMDQGSLLRTQSPLAEIMQIDLGFVTARLVISEKGPEGN
jgi:hypothetical protein